MTSAIVFRAIRKIWFRVAYKAKPLSLMASVPSLAGTFDKSVSLRWIPSVKISGVLRQVLSFESPGRVTFRFKVSYGTRFHTFIACVSEKSEGCRDRIDCSVEIKNKERFERVVCRKKIPVDRDMHSRNWREVNVDLKRFSGQDIELTLAAAKSANSSRCSGWSLWGEPLLLERKSRKEMWADLENYVRAFGLFRCAIEMMKLLLEQITERSERGDPSAKELSSPIGCDFKNHVVRQTKAIGFGGVSLENRKFVLYVSSRGNYFYREIADLLAAGFRELGYQAAVRNEKNAFGTDADWHVVVAPHEFFYLGRGIGIGNTALPSNLILLNTEQLWTNWFAKAYRFFSTAHAIWDIDRSASEFLRSRGFKASFLPLGYVRDFEEFQEVMTLPRHEATRGLSTDILDRSFLHAPISQRPIDILFIGYLSPRRARFFANASRYLSRHNCFFKFSHGTSPVVPGENSPMNTATAIGLAQRSKIVLNIHQGDDKYFEWHRVVMHGLWQKALVVTEEVDAVPPFEAGRDFVASCLKGVPEQIDFYLCSVEGRQLAQAIADCGYRTLSERCRLSECLRTLLAEMPVEPAEPRSLISWAGSE